MGAGLARQIKNKYPVVFEEYKKLVKSNSDKSKLLGKHQCVLVGECKYVSNLFGQKAIGRYKKQTDYIALSSSLNKLALLAKKLF